MATAQTKGKSKISGILPTDTYDAFLAKASDLRLTPSELLRQLIAAFINGDIKLPLNPAIMENYE